MLRQIEVCFNCELESSSISKLLSVAHFKITSGMMNCVGLQASYAPARLRLGVVYGLPAILDLSVKKVVI